mmetsp:Transcript_12934/g.35866  ORF Transcript_12934/g.35866 Transcript_12934/m.35866 type:complete len:283 (+) Transcript_12934:58-906(+)
MTSTFTKALGHVSGAESVKSKISKATQDDEAPTPGYLQEELKKITYEGAHCCEVEDHLLLRLQVKSSNVKIKSLRLIKTLCERGSPNFRRDLQRRTNAVRECLHWTCDPHPALGDIPAKLVRETAQEVINVILDSESRASTQSSQPSQYSGISSQSQVGGGTPMQGFGNGSTMQGFGNGGSSMQGFGSGGPQNFSSAGRCKYEGFGSDSQAGRSGGGGADDRSILSYASTPSVGDMSSSRMQGFGSAPMYAGGGGKMDKVKQVGAKAASMLSAGNPPAALSA